MGERGETDMMERGQQQANRNADAALHSGALTTAKCQGCKLAPLGVVPALRTHFSMTARGTAWAEKLRTVRRRLTKR